MTRGHQSRISPRWLQEEKEASWHRSSRYLKTARFTRFHNVSQVLWAPMLWAILASPGESVSESGAFVAVIKHPTTRWNSMNNMKQHNLLVFVVNLELKSRLKWSQGKRKRRRRSQKSQRKRAWSHSTILNSFELYPFHVDLLNGSIYIYIYTYDMYT